MNDVEPDPGYVEPDPGSEAPDPGNEAPARTGEPRVDAALQGLSVLAELPVAEHPGVFERVHGELVEVLGELRSVAQAGPGGSGGPQQ